MLDRLLLQSAIATRIANRYKPLSIFTAWKYWF